MPNSPTDLIDRDEQQSKLVKQIMKVLEEKTHSDNDYPHIYQDLFQSLAVALSHPDAKQPNAAALYREEIEALVWAFAKGPNERNYIVLLLIQKIVNERMYHDYHRTYSRLWAIDNHGVGGLSAAETTN